jgi:tryptophan-rich sensory protein
VFWAILVGLLVRFWRADRIAGALWSPYVAWVSFATVLNGTIWWLNR